MSTKTFFVLLMVGFFGASEMSLGQRGGRGGGGARGGGGGFGGRPGGPAVGGGGAQRPQMPQPAQRPQLPQGQPAQRPQLPQGQPAQRPAAGGNLGGGANNGGQFRPPQLGTPSQLPSRAPSAPGAGSGLARPGVGSGFSGSPTTAGGAGRPTNAQLDKFLGNTTPQKPLGASQLPTTGGSSIYNTQRGGTVQVDRGAGQRTTPGGTTIGGAGRQVTVETANGRTATGRWGVAGATGPNGSAIASGRSTAVTGALGMRTNTQGGYATSNGRWGVGGATAVQGRNGYTAVNVRGAGGIAGVGGRAGSVTAVRGPLGNTVVAGRGASFVNGQFVHGHAWTNVNGAYRGWNSFYSGWHAGGWWPGKWAVAGAVTWAAWATFGWSDVSGYAYPSGDSGEPIYYDYGNTVTFNEGNVYYDDKPIATTAEYYDQAVAIAKDGLEDPKDAKEVEWMPLGVFAVVEESKADNKDKPLAEADLEKVLQLALSKDGLVRGNYQVSAKADPEVVRGKLDRKTQAVTLQIADDDKAVLETGLYNLTNDEAPAMLFWGPGEKERVKLVLVRLANKKAGEIKAK